MFKRFDPSALCIPYSAGAEIWIRELATGRETRIAEFTQPFGTFFTPETNRADNQIMFDTGGVVCRVNLDGTNRFCSTLGLTQANFTHPSVRGGDYLSVMASEQLTPALGGLYTFNYNLTNPQKVPNTSRTDESPSWSNNGQTIAYGFVPPPDENPQFYADLYKINADGSNKTRLTFLNGTTSGSPNGFRHSLVWTTNSVGDEFIYNAVNVNNIAGIYKISTDGTGNMTRIPITAGNAPDWVGGIVPVFGEQQVASFGGGATSGGNYTLVDTIGQAFAGQTSTGGSYNLRSGFWADVTTSARTRFDFDGDGKSDVSVFRPSNGAWYIQQSTAGFTGVTFGLSTDKIVPADYDGDGKTDVAVYRDGTWYLQRSTLGFTGVAFGAATDIPAPADFDGDGRSELVVFRPSNGGWYLYNLANNQNSSVGFGTNGDIPVAADYDGDGKADVAVFRPSSGVWYLQRSNLGFTGIAFGAATDKTVPADYDGDGKADVAVFRPSNGTWYLLNSTTGFTGTLFGQTGDQPAAADYDGDNKADIAVFRSGTWYLLRTAAGFTGVTFGLATDKPVPNAFVP